MIRDLLQGTPQSIDLPDVCIVGAGAAGIVLAVELARQGKRVVLLEGGGPAIEEESQETYNSEVAGLQHNGIHIGRFRSLGGTTTRWGGQILELDELDFEARPWIERSGWPFPKKTLAPFYDRAIAMEGLSNATLEDEAVWHELGMTPPQFAGFESFFSRWCPETNFARLHGRELSNNPLIEVWLHANAVAPVMEGSRVRGIRCRTLTVLEHTFHAKHFVWCMGGIESSRFFLQPELANMPWHRSGLLGKHFQDHLMVSAATIELIEAPRFHAAFDNVFSRGYKYHPKMRLAPALQEQTGTLNTAALILFQSDSDEAGTKLKATAKKLLRGHFADTTYEEVVQLFRDAPLLGRQSWRYFVAHRAYIPSDARIELGVQCEQPPTAASSITLSDQRDRLGLLRTRIDWQISELEIRSIRSCVAAAAKALEAVAHVLPDPDLLDAPEKFRDKCVDQYHHMGGMRLSVSPDTGVVDTDLKLHGIENGYICSAAVFPSSGFSNPTHTVIALAIRLADHLGRL